MRKRKFNPHKFDFSGYAAEFDFCDKREMERVYNALIRAWLWGMCGV